MRLLPLTLIAAVARNGVIGRDGGMPWHLPGDLAHFRASTMGKPVIMGRRTFDALPTVLHGRYVVVVTRNPATLPSGVESAGDPQEALARAEAIGRPIDATEIMIAGGAAIYEAYLPHATSLLLTEVECAPDGDAKFPPVDRAVWSVVDHRRPVPTVGDRVPYTVVRYARVTAPTSEHAPVRPQS